MSGESLVVLAVLPVIVLMLLLGWLLLFTRGGRPVKLGLRGFGIEINVDSSARNLNNKEV